MIYKGILTTKLFKDTGKSFSEALFLVSTKMTSSYHLCVKCFSQLSFDSEVYTKSATAADFVYTFESNESCEKHSTEK